MERERELEKEREKYNWRERKNWREKGREWVGENWKRGNRESWRERDG